ncbi:MAG: tetratricopeptide repeat protein [Pedosphaera sp.]|nr:tetratricopeptide repeat protein [Pedosphaera sp.]
MMSSAVVSFCSSTLRCGLCWLGLALSLHAADEVNVRALRAENLLQAAVRSFSLSNWITAGEWFQEYQEANPDSPKRPFALLHQAQSLFRQERYRDCFNLLNNEKANAAGYADEFAFWMAESRLREGNAVAAAELFRDIPRLYPNSARAIDALLSLVVASADQENWGSIVEILRPPEGIFQRFALTHPADKRTSEGNLLLAEALHRQGQHQAASDLLDIIGAKISGAEAHWRVRHLQARLFQVQGRFPEALSLLDSPALAQTQTNVAARQAERLRLRGEVLAQLRRHDEAAADYARLSAVEMPPAYRRLALLELSLQQVAGSFAGMLVSDSSGLELLTESDSAVLRLTEGELRLRQLSASPSQPLSPALQSNLVFQAKTNFAAAIVAPFAGHAHLGLAWASWQQGDMGGSGTNYFQAANTFAQPAQRAHARVKAAEAQFRSGDFTNALAQCQSVLLPVPEAERPSTALLDHARFLAVRSAVALESIHRTGVYLPFAMQAMGQFAGSPNAALRVQAILLVAQQQAPEPARKILEALPSQSTNAPLSAQATLEKARTYIADRKWDEALQHYRAWLEANSKADPAWVAQVKLDLAWIHQQNAQEAQALEILTNVIAQHPDTLNAARAQMRVADHYFHLSGTNHVQAEARYQLVQGMSNSPPALRHRAAMMAGRSALARQNYPNARAYFEGLVADEKCPVLVKGEAIFALGDTAILDPAKPPQKFDEAIAHFEKLIGLVGNPTNLLAVQAQGRIGDCHLQLAAEAPQRFAGAQKAYETVLQLTEALPGDSDIRTSAMLGLANVYEKKTDKDLSKAIGLYQKVFEAAGAAGPQQDPFWIQQAGLGAARLLQQENRHREALDALKRLGVMFPKMQPALQPRKEQLLQLMKAPGSR